MQHAIRSLLITGRSWRHWSLSRPTINRTVMFIPCPHRPQRPQPAGEMRPPVKPCSRRTVDWLSCGFTSHSTQNKSSQRYGRKLNLNNKTHSPIKRNVLQHVFVALKWPQLSLRVSTVFLLFTKTVKCNTNIHSSFCLKSNCCLT